jgi:hypothetical protein
VVTLQVLPAAVDASLAPAVLLLLWNLTHRRVFDLRGGTRKKRLCCFVFGRFHFVVPTAS